MIQKEIIKVLEEALDKLAIQAKIELTPAKKHGDFSTNIALKLAGQLKDKPLNIAEQIKAQIKSDLIARLSIDGPGFINIFLSSKALKGILGAILLAQDQYGQGQQNKKINVEYVSANPTGYLHLGHAKNAAIGSTLTNILRFAGNEVDAEFYINDAGNQMDLLALSVFTRYQELLGLKVTMPEDAYHGLEIAEVAKTIYAEVKDQYASYDYEAARAVFKARAKTILLGKIKEHLGAYQVQMDRYFSEADLYDHNLIDPALKALQAHLYQHEGATWLKTTAAGDDKDRVLIKQNGKFTYFLPDIAYHKIKLDRGYDELINIWGADHIGYIKRLEVALTYLGLPSDRLDILVVQLVKLVQKGQEVRMSKRQGTSYWLIDLIQKVGVDAARWFMLDGALNSELIFDLDKALAKNNENPVFFVQYAHARAHQLVNRLSDVPHDEDYTAQEGFLIKELARFQAVVLTIANTHKVNLLTQYLLHIASLFNSWYSNTRALGTTREQIAKALAQGVMIILANGLRLLGITAPKKM